MILTKTPLRISFSGGGSDYIEKKSNLPGQVISSTINKFIYIMINKKHDQKERQHGEQKTVEQRALLLLLHPGVCQNNGLVISGNSSPEVKVLFNIFPIFPRKPNTSTSLDGSIHGS